MDQEYDVIVLGTGLTECILSGLFSIEKRRVLHIDRNNYYGAECASLNLSQVYSTFRPAGSQPPPSLGKDRDYNVDLVPKFIMANSDLVKILVRTDVTRYMEFKQIAGSFVYRDGRISKVPATDMEALSSPLMGFFEKRRARSFFQFLQLYKQEDAQTHQGMDLTRTPMSAVYAYFGLEAGTQDFVGHALALYLTDDYINKPAAECYRRIMMYMSSLAQYGKSPYIYPEYGLGELPQGFARLAAIYGGTYMLDKHVDDIVTGPDGRVQGVKCGDEVVKCKAVICDPSYAGRKVRKTGRVIRAICLLNHSIPNTGDADSVQIIVPQKQVRRTNDIYVACVSSAHKICAKDHWVAIVSTIVETANPEAEIQVGVDLLGPVLEKFVSVKDIYEPCDDGTQDQVFVTRSYDATSHFETVVDDLKDVYRRVTGRALEVDKQMRGSVDDEQKAMQQQP